MNLIHNKIWFCLILLFFSCSKDIVEEINEPLMIEFEVFYIINGDTLSDTGSKIFTYYNINQSNILDYNIINDGKLIDLMETSSTIYPDIKGKIAETGKYTLIPPKGTENLLVIIWSNFYKERNLKSIFTEYDFYYHGSDQLVKLYFLEKNHGFEG